MKSSASAERQLTWRVTLALVCGMGLSWLGGMGCSSPKKEPDFKLMTQAWNTIQSQYVNRSSLRSEDLTYGAISGMVDALGDTGHSTFLTPAMVKDLKNMERGEFKGIGIEIQVKGARVVVVAPIDGSPAERAGLRPGDIILKVSGQDITDWPLARIAEKITGRTGTKVTLTLEDPRTGLYASSDSRTRLSQVAPCDMAKTSWDLDRSSAVGQLRQWRDEGFTLGLAANSRRRAEGRGSGFAQ